MKKIALLFVGICGLTTMVSAQTFTNTRLLSESATRLKLASASNYAKAVAMARQKNWPLSYTNRNGKLSVLIGVDDFGIPKYYATNNNTIAAATTRANQLWPGGSTGLGLSGSSANMKNKMGIWDGGGVLTTHQELAGRVTQKDNPSSIIDHSTHVAGTLIASGVNPAAKGMAFGLQGLVAYDFNSDQAEMANEAANNNLLVSNHSYSIVAGWNYNSSQNRWEFNGRYNENEDYKFGFYGDDAANLDDITYNAPYYLVVKSAGNTRTETGPAVGQTYYRYNQSGQMTSAGARPDGISSNDSYDGISWDCGAKNILTVGAVFGLPNGYSRKEDVQLASFSSWGPTDDGRIKPDIVADGMNVLSSINTSNTSYSAFSGTSMASPNAAGSLFLLQEYYSKIKSGAFLRSATLKGLAIHTAEEAGTYDGPDYQYGWGLLNVEKAAAVLTAAVGSNNSATSASQLYETTLAQGATFTKTVVATGKGKLQATICWTDVKGTVETTNTLNNRTKKLVNDLDIRITKGSRTYYPWTLSVDNPAAPAVPGDNVLDNVERIDIDSTIPGQTYTITVSHKGTLAKGPQAFSLIISGVGGAAYCTSASGGGGARIDSVVLKSMKNVNTAGSKTYTDNTSYIAKLEQGETAQIKVGVGTADNTTASRIVKVFIDYNNNGVFDANELVANSGILNATPQVFTGTIVVPSTVTIGNINLMRVIVQETSNLADINACGAYGKGETQDYTVWITNPSSDMTITGITTPESLDCATDSMYVTLALRNNGSVSKSNIPVTAAIASASGVVANITATYPGTIPAFTTVDFTLQKPMTLAAGTLYAITATVNDPTDQFNSNNQIVTNFTTAAKPTSPVAVASICSGTTVNLKVTNADGNNYFWYTTPTGGQPFAYGSSTTSATLPSNNTFYVAKEARMSIGPVNKLVYPSGGYNHFNGNFMRFKNTVPVVLESVRLYVGNPGKIKITVGNIITESADGSYNYNVISSKTLDLFATKPNPGPNPTTATTNENPVDDTGAVFHLGIPVLATGDHIINVTLLYPDGTPIPNTVTSTGASLFRNGGITSTTTYPTGSSLIAQFTGNSASGTGVTQSQFYYFFYDLKVSTVDCMSDRIPVVATLSPTPVVSKQGNQLVSSITTGIQWYRAGIAVAGATSTPFTPTQSGDYSVISTDATGCQKTSNTVNYVITAIDPIVSTAEINLKVSPNPNNGLFNLSFEVTDKADLTIELVNAAGQKAYRQTQSNFVGKYSKDISIPNLAAGVYVLTINHNKKNYVYKVIVGR